MKKALIFVAVGRITHSSNKADSKPEETSRDCAVEQYQEFYFLLALYFSKEFY